MPDLIPEEVQRFLVDQIDSIAELEALLILREHRDQSCPCGLVADRIYVSEEVTAGLLVKLAKRGFLTTDGMTPASFRYAPCSQEMARLLDQLAEVYVKYLVPVTDLVHKKSRRNIQGIAEAFTFKKEK
ncbi:MAG: hypothetical protein ABIU05_26890 [Nitrospirales bacterium]